MKPEIEATYLEQNHEKIRDMLKSKGATCLHEKYLMKRTIFDYPDLRLDNQAAWIRVRQEATKTTMGFKQRQDETIEGMREIEFTIDDYTKACDFLEAIGLAPKAVQESRREIWRLGDCEIMLDEWPWIPTYIEIEGPTKEAVQKVTSELGLDYNTAIFDSTDAIYQKYFDVSRTEISTVPIKFGPIPNWLEEKRKAS
jgi:adenylate cyclase, class 2